MSRRRMIYLGFTVVSVTAFIIDRVFLGEPASAVAEVPEHSSPGAQAPKVSAVKKPNPKQAEAPVDVSLAPLSRLPERRAARDVFVPTESMERYYRQFEEAAQRAEQKGPKPGSPEAFAAEHHLQGTSNGPGGGVATINGKVLKIGDTLSSFRLTRVSAKEVEFRRGRDRVVLSLTAPGAP